MCLSWYRRSALDDSSGKLFRELVASVIDTALSLFEVELSIVVIRLDAVIVAPLKIGFAVVTAQCELAPSYFAVLFELNEFFDCIVYDWNS